MKENIKTALIAILFFAVLVLSQYLGIYIDRDNRNQILIDSQVEKISDLEAINDDKLIKDYLRSK